MHLAVISAAAATVSQRLGDKARLASFAVVSRASDDRKTVASVPGLPVTSFYVTCDTSLAPSTSLRVPNKAGRPGDEASRVSVSRFTSSFGAFTQRCGSRREGVTSRSSKYSWLLRRRKILNINKFGLGASMGGSLEVHM